MADFDTSFSWMMVHEDPRLECKTVSDAAPSGVPGPCYAISGVNSGAWPAEYEAIAAEPQENRAPLVRQFYKDNFWNRWYDQLESTELAQRVFDFAVNGGSGTAVRCLQRAVNSLGVTTLDVDGGWGPSTLTEANAADPEALLEAFKRERTKYYEKIASMDPSKQKYLPQWTARASK